MSCLCVIQEFAYNADGIRNGKGDSSGANSGFIIDNNLDYAQVIREDDGTTIVSYTYGDDLVSQNREGVLSYYLYDGLGSTRALSDAAGNITDEYNYEAFGELLNQVGSTENDYLFAGEQFDEELDQYYLRARYYNQNTGRFTQQDTYLGNNFDPVSLHKYLYANSDPVSYTDPTGNFSLGSLMSGINTAATLVNVATTSYDVAGLFIESGTGGTAPSAGDIGGAIILGVVSKKVLKPLSKLCQKNKKAKRYCNYAVGYVGAELKIEQLAQSKTSNWLSKKRKNTIVGAFNLINGKSVAAFNRGKDTNPPTPTHPSLRSLAKKSIGHIGCVDSGSGNTIGNCAEFMAANKLLFGGAKRKAIRFTFSYHVAKTGKNGTRGFIKSYCGVCQKMFNVKN